MVVEGHRIRSALIQSSASMAFGAETTTVCVEHCIRMRWDRCFDGVSTARVLHSLERTFTSVSISAEPGWMSLPSNQAKSFIMCFFEGDAKRSTGLQGLMSAGSRLRIDQCSPVEDGPDVLPFVRLRMI